MLEFYKTYLFCLCWFLLIFTNINIKLSKKMSFFVIASFENCVSLTGTLISNPNSIYLEPHRVLFLISCFH